MEEEEMEEKTGKEREKKGEGKLVNINQMLNSMKRKRKWK